MKARYKDKMPKPETEVSMGNLYDLNKQLMQNIEPVTDEALIEIKDKLRSWIMNQYEQKYLMLLCAERKDYTLFNLSKTHSLLTTPPMTIWHAANDVIECMTNRGQLLSMELLEDGAWEIWIKTEEECFAYYLFPYGTAVIEY